MDARLVASATAHNVAMSSGCGPSHQCPGEPAFDVRIRAQSVSAHWFAENVGMGGPITLSTQGAWSMARRLTTDMLAEQAPNDGHKQNILDPDLHLVGIAVTIDARGVLWLTEDFCS